MHIIGCVSQKGGVGKSTLTRLLATEFTRAGWRTKIADMDLAQTTSTQWGALRMNNAIKPSVAVEPFAKVADALKSAGTAELLIFDGKPSADTQVLDIGRAANLVVMPTGASYDDLSPTLQLAKLLIGKGIPRAKIVAVLNGSMSNAEEADARSFLEGRGVAVIAGSLQGYTSYRSAMNSGLSPAEVRGQAALQDRAKGIATAIAQKLTEN